MLAWFGADVIKVERPDGGDATRRFVPPIKGESSSFMMINRNKRGIAIDPASGSLARRALFAQAQRAARPRAHPHLPAFRCSDCALTLAAVQDARAGWGGADASLAGQGGCAAMHRR